MKEDRRIQLTTKGNKKVMLLTQLITLTGSQEQKLNCEPLLPELEKIAKKLEIDWAVELSANIEYGTLAVSRTYENEIGNCEFNSIEKAAKEFLNAVDKLELQKQESECPSHEKENDVQCTVDMMKQIVKDIDKGDKVCALLGIGMVSVFVGKGQILSPLLKELCQLYIDKYDKQ